MISIIPKRVVEEIREVSQYAGNCDDWVTIKKEIMKSCPPNLRKLFSRRDPITKEQVPNDFDMAVKEEFEKLSGRKLVIRSLSQRRDLSSNYDK